MKVDCLEFQAHKVQQVLMVLMDRMDSMVLVDVIQVSFDCLHISSYFEYFVIIKIWMFLSVTSL